MKTLLSIVIVFLISLSFSIISYADNSHCEAGFHACMEVVEDNFNENPYYDFVSGMRDCTNGLRACLNTPEIELK